MELLTGRGTGAKSVEVALFPDTMRRSTQLGNTLALIDRPPELLLLHISASGGTTLRVDWDDATRWCFPPNPKSSPFLVFPPITTIRIMDRRTPYTLSVLAPSTTGADESRTTIQNRLRDFVLEFQLDNAFIYRYTSHTYNCAILRLGANRDVLIVIN